MYLNNEVQALYEKLKKSESLKDFKITKAYPYLDKPTRLSTQVIVVSPSSIDAQSASLGNEEFYGKYAIDIDVFSPYALGSPVMSDALQRVLVSATDKTVAGISVSPVCLDENSHCFNSKCRLTYRYTYTIGEDNDE